MCPKIEFDTQTQANIRPTVQKWILGRFPFDFGPIAGVMRDRFCTPRTFQADFSSLHAPQHPIRANPLMWEPEGR